MKMKTHYHLNGCKRKHWKNPIPVHDENRIKLPYSEKKALKKVSANNIFNDESLNPFP